MSSPGPLQPSEPLRWPPPTPSDPSSARADVRFLASPDYVGQDFFPDVFRPCPPTGPPTRSPESSPPSGDNDLPKAGVPDAVPIRVRENGRPIGAVVPGAAVGSRRVPFLSSWRWSPVTGRRSTPRHHRGLDPRARLPPCRSIEGDIGWRRPAHE
ncbi:hypothetical protein [Streptomyces sp. NPDC059215]|uniref:hypothetical protein n=1 Tax=Streptomyces sp. NPDC059215 TaxID=3346772 RepID=UPI0036AC68A2